MTERYNSHSDPCHVCRSARKPFRAQATIERFRHQYPGIKLLDRAQFANRVAGREAAPIGGWPRVAPPEKGHPLACIMSRTDRAYGPSRGAMTQRGSLPLYHGGNKRRQDQLSCACSAPIGSAYGNYTVMAVRAGTLTGPVPDRHRPGQSAPDLWTGCGHGSDVPAQSPAFTPVICDWTADYKSGSSGLTLWLDGDQVAPADVVAIGRRDREQLPMPCIRLTLPLSLGQAECAIEQLAHRDRR